MIELTTYPGLDERIVILRAGDLVDSVFVRTQRFNVLFDTQYTPEACQSALSQLGGISDRPMIVVNSHMDWDHFWGNAAVAGWAIIVAHERAIKRFRAPAAAEKLRVKTAEDPQFSGVKLVAPTMTFADRLRLQGGDLTLELFSTPGHTPDHIAAWIPELKTCLAVDAVERPIPKVWSDDPDDLAALVGSLRAIKALGAQHVVLAHGQSSSPAVVDANLAYFDALAERVRRLGGAQDVFERDDLPEELGLWALTPRPADLSPDAESFYQGFHRANLRATVRSVAESGADG